MTQEKEELKEQTALKLIGTSAEDQIRDLLADITLGQPSSGVRLRNIHQVARCYIARLREVVAEIEEAAIEHIEATGEDISLENGLRWYVGVERKTTARCDDEVLKAILNASGGDVSRLTTGVDGVLVSSPWKNGTVRQLVGDETFDRLFATKTTCSLETGKAKRVLKMTAPLGLQA